MKKYNFILALSLFTVFGFSQTRVFEPIVDIEATEVISQGNTGTCWSFSASSFLESEIIRINKKRVDLSEMFNVRHTYKTKAWNYVMRQGKINFSQGGLGHDVINSISEYGFVPNSFYTGLKINEEKHNHSKLIDTLKPILDSYIGRKITDWKTPVNSILDEKLGVAPTTFFYEGVNYTPKSFMTSLKINADDYVSITSFNHAPFYSNFVLNIPDNFSNGAFYNVPLQDLMDISINALDKGYTIELDCDVSEKTFSGKFGLAVIPVNNELKDIKVLTAEKNISQAYRQQEFENYNTTDDHLMHITGYVKDQNGTIYFKVKNSWGTKTSEKEGYIYMSEAYFKLKTISILLHKKGVQKTLRKKVGIK
jgi:bleomycin hydrolase